VYKFNMKNEKEPSGNKVFEEGWHDWEVVKLEETTSKQGNEMFVITLAENKTFESIDIFAITAEGKRWFLKQFLTACGITTDKEGVMEWDITDVIGKRISGKIENEPNTWIDREGKERSGTKSRLVRFEAIKADI